MRKKERIKPFLEEIGKLWETVPDWRFGQLIINVFGVFDSDPWFYEEDKMLEKWKEFFNVDSEEVTKEIPDFEGTMEQLEKLTIKGEKNDNK